MKGALFVFERKYESHISVIYLYFAPKIFELTNKFLLNLQQISEQKQPCNSVPVNSFKLGYSFFELWTALQTLFLFMVQVDGG